MVMRLYVGITDRDWYQRLSALRPDEVNFWKPGESGSFGALAPGELFLFKLHAPEHYIVGGAHFVRFSRLSMSLAWLAFGEKNGVGSAEEFRRRIQRYRKADLGPDPSVGNIVLTEPFWLERDAWIPVPADWPTNTVQGKTFDATKGSGYVLRKAVEERLRHRDLGVREERGRYGAHQATHRLGQGAFRVVVTEAYSRKCAVTGESTLPVLEAAHIRPYSDDGPHDVRNGLLLRSDMHILYDKGLLTVTPDLRLEVSSHIRKDYVNGKRYYAFQGEGLRTLPTALADHPGPEFLRYHNEHIFLL